MNYMNVCRHVTVEVHVTMFLVCLLTLCSVGSSGLGTESATCNTWYYTSVNHTQLCVCGNTLNGGLLCSENDGQQHVYRKINYCVSQMNSGELLAGLCRYGYQQNSSLVYNRIYSLLPENPDDLNEIQCQQYKRKGLLCGECTEDHGPSIYSFKYTLKCSKCSHMSPVAASAVYLVLELVPVTIFFFLIMTFRINIMSGPLLGYIIFCQVHMRATQTYLSVQYSILSYLGQPAQFFLHLASFLSGIWSLDLFKPNTAIIPPFCISEKISDIDALLFDYIIVVYIIVLSLVTYFCIELHSRNCRIFVLLWKPFHLLCIKIRKRWSSSDSSIIHAFATLLILLFMRLNTTMYDISTVSPLFTTNDTQVQTYVVSYKPQIKGFSPEHIHYLLVPFLFLFLFGFCPALFLCLYPTHFFRQITNCCFSARRLIAMKVFAETFQGCYKDGLNGTRDYRWTPAIIMFWVMIWTVIISLKYSLTHSYTVWVAPMVMLLFSVCVSYMRPCKSWLMNLSLSFHFTVVSLLCLVFGMWLANVLSSYILAYLFVILLIIPHGFMMLWAGYRIVCFVREHRSQIYNYAIALIITIIIIYTAHTCNYTNFPFPFT